MVKRFSSAPVELPPVEHRFERADLIFYGIDHSGPSFEGQVFLDAGGVGPKADESHRAYVGSFFIFGHGGCFGDIGHCEIPASRDPFDLRAPHQLEPALRILTVTDAIHALLERGVDAAKATVIARTEARRPDDVLAFETVRLVTYA